MKTQLAVLLLAAAALAAEEQRITSYRNPVIPGFHPDPSVVRVGGDYYLVNSSFEFFPGVPLFTSRDLVHWKPLGHVLTRDSQLPLARARASGGIYAPTLRHHDGTFYMITTNVDGGGNFYVTAKDPPGPWSEPIWVRDQGGIDPSLFFDDDGTVYLTTNGGAPGGKGPRGIYQSRDRPRDRPAARAPRHVWPGTGGRYPEGPHLYKIRGRYYLMISEGGTEYGHMMTIARSDSPWGPFEACPATPSSRTGAPRWTFPSRARATPTSCRTPRAAGGWCSSPSGPWRAVLAPPRPRDVPRARDLGCAGLARRERGQGRDARDDRPRAPGRTLAQAGRPYRLCPAPRARVDVPPQPQPRLVRAGRAARLAHRARRSRLSRGCGLADVARPEAGTPGVRRGGAPRLRAGGDGEEAGLTVYRSHEHRYEIGVSRVDGRRRVFVRQTIGPSLQAVTASAPLDGPEPVLLRIEATPETYAFSFGREKPTEWTPLGTAPTRFLSTEVASGFTGAFFALYATGNGQPSTTPARFDCFDYEPKQD